MATDLKNIERRPYSYWVLDGIPDLTAGMILLASAGLWLVGMSLPRNPVVWIPFWIIMPIALTAISLLQRTIVRRLKERITDPRTGHIEMRGPSRVARVVGLTVALLFAASVIYSALTGKGLAMLPLDRILGSGAPALLGIVFFLAGLHRRRYLFLTGLCLASAAIGYWGRLGFVNFLWTLASVGLVLVVTGMARLRRYIRANPGGEASA